MKHHILIFLALFMIALFALTGCASTSMDKPSVSKTPDCSLQVQRSVTLTTGRYISIIKSIQDGESDKAIEDMDWWLDMAIIELNFLNEKYPNKNLAERDVPNTDGFLQMKVLYKKIANYRSGNPRIHKIPLNSHQSKAIENFLEKYK